MNYFITGISGFVAGHLVEAIYHHDKKAQVTGVDIRDPNLYFLDNAVSESVSFKKVNLLDIDELTQALRTSQPHFIIHLASFSSVAYSWQHPMESFKNNSNVFLNLLEAVRHTNRDVRILAIGSSEQYGIVSHDKIPLKETESPNPSSPYAVARVAQEYMAAVYVKGFKLDIVSTRSFNHCGPRQDHRFVLSGFAKQLAEVRKGKRAPVIHVGELGVIRDFTDVRDIVKAYVLLLRKGKAGDIYNICSGIGRKIEDCLNMMTGIAGITCEIKVEEDLIRPIDNPIIIGDNTKVKNQTGWSTDISFENTLADLLNSWLH